MEKIHGWPEIVDGKLSELPPNMSPGDVGVALVEPICYVESIACLVICRVVSTAWWPNPIADTPNRLDHGTILAVIDDADTLSSASGSLMKTAVLNHKLHELLGTFPKTVATAASGAETAVANAADLRAIEGLPEGTARLVHTPGVSNWVKLLCQVCAQPTLIAPSKVGNEMPPRIAGTKLFALEEPIQCADCGEGITHCEQSNSVDTRNPNITQRGAHVG